MEELQPDFEDVDSQPKTLTKTRHIKEIKYVAGRAPVKDQTEYEIMLVTTAVEEDEATSAVNTSYGYRIKQDAEYLKGASGVLRDVALRAGVDIDTSYYTAVCKWLLPKTKRNKPTVKELRWGMPVLLDEITRVKPKIIVCLGKQAFDMLSDEKISFKDAHGCWFWSSIAKAHIYLMYNPYALVSKPEMYEVFRIDFKEISRRKELLDQGLEIGDAQMNWEVIRDMQSLEDWADRLMELHEADAWPGHKTDEGLPLVAVDCEWHGKVYIDGDLRTIQFAWSETDAVSIEFLDETKNWSFDLDDDSYDSNIVEDLAGKYRAIGDVLKHLMDTIDVRYIGHHYAADAPWMKHWLGMSIFGKCYFDTEFAQQTVDESSELGLERGIAMKYTNLGRYDQKLVLWKRANKKLVEGGYGFVPSSIIHEYGCKDVVTPMRAYPLIRAQLVGQRLWDYYRNIFNPFVTDVFVEFHMTGMPMDIELMDDLRNLFTFTVDKLNIMFRENMHNEALNKIRATIIADLGLPSLMKLNHRLNSSEYQDTKTAIKTVLAENDMLKDIPKWNTMIDHLSETKSFNLRSPNQMARWLFEFEGLTPIKSTNQKAKGLPSMDWEKVMELPPDRRSEYRPAVDKQTLEILSDQCPRINELLNLNAVGNLSKAFMKEPDVYIDGTTGEEVVEENGLHAWLCSDGRVHG